MHRALTLFAFVLLVGLSGCYSSPYFPTGTTTQAVLNGNNYRVVQTSLQASDTGFRVFGFGSDPNMHVVMDRIRAQAQLDGRPRALVNVTLDDSGFNIGIVSSHSITLSADVVEFIAPAGGGSN